ncbi:MAG: hypothetical protein HOI70_08270 [Opitutae bacterium]|jgi:glycosyltransferase involved in cell wall biosynthesis|nr:hypothetical protein [Opitutae bacterium]
MTNSKTLKVFVGPYEIAGYYSNLVQGLQQINVDCDYITYSSNKFNYGGETKTPWLLKCSKSLSSIHNQHRSFISKFTFSIPAKFLRHLWAWLAIFRYDVFIFAFGASLFRGNHDLIILKLLRKRVITNLAHGFESRPPFMDGSYQTLDGKQQPSHLELLKLTQKKHRRVSRFDKYSQIIIGAPSSTSQFLKSKFINTQTMGIPFGGSNQIAEGDISLSNKEPDAPIRILHCPSHPAAKGSFLVEKAIENLRTRGYRINLVLLKEKPHSEVIDEIKLCDFVVDQVYSDTPMAGFPTEAAWFGKPAIVGGYSLDYLREFAPSNMLPPSQTCHPDDLQDTIEEFISNPKERIHLGAQAQEFVRKKWNQVEVAKRYLRLIRGDVPEDWWLVPSEIVYLEGAGQRVEITKENIKGMVELYGVESLHLKHHPTLEQACIEFAGIKTC